MPKGSQVPSTKAGRPSAVTGGTTHTKISGPAKKGTNGKGRVGR